MDKYEYKVRSEEISNLIEEEKYTEAVSIADTIDWRRVKSVTMLLKIAALYRVNRRNEDSRAILSLAYDRYPTNRSVVYSLCEVSIELDDIVAAIEYYKQFARLAPKDNGVYTLRYRILEAQEASLEERIEILEELKKRDYQEEWAYELAYLYHRVGLSTKCVEECDDIILWFGDGPFVMKAMELKGLHVPLTEVQQLKYESMLSNSDENYVEESAENDAQQEYDNTDYINQNTETYDNSSQVYADENYIENNYTEYNEETYTDEHYSNEEYEQETYLNEEYPEYNYNEEAYVNENYEDEEYINEEYAQETYADENYDGYSEEYSNEQEMYEDEEYVNDGYVQETYFDESYETPHSSAEDMSQYNTINLQKVVAESMKELFPDDDVFAEERERFNTEEIERNDMSNTLVYMHKPEMKESENDSPINEIKEDTEIEISEEISDISVKEEQTLSAGKVSRMVTGVSEVAPEPHTGAIKKVIIPGDDARFIQASSDMDELRDTTEKSVDEEHIRMESNEENVYHEQSIMDIEPHDEETSKTLTGQMNIDEVLEEWERMKLDKAKEHQEEIKKHVITQTGRIFANFDNSVKSGILGELETEENINNSDDTFLQADITSDIPQDSIENIVDEEFDTAYTTEERKSNISDNIRMSDTFESIEYKNPETEYVYDDIESQEYAESEEIYDEIESQEYAESEEIYDEIESQEYAESEEIYDEIESQEYAESEEIYDEIESQEYEESEEIYDEVESQEYEEPEEIYDEVESQEYEESEEIYEDIETVYNDGLDPEDAESIAEMAIEDAMKTQEIKMNTADLSSLSEKIVATTNKEATGAKREEIRDFTEQEQELFENFAVTKKIKKQIIFALENMTLAAYTGNIIITGDAGLDTIRMAKNLVKEYHDADANFSGKVAKITGEKINQRNLKEIFEKLNNGGIIIEKANGMSEEKLYEMASLLNQENIGIVVILEDTKKEITKLLQKQAMIADYFNIRIDLMEMDNNALVAYAKNYALALEYSIDELGTLALYTRIANMQSGNHVVTKDEVRDIIDEAIWKSKKSKIKNFVDVLFARRYDSEDMIVLKERDFM